MEFERCTPGAALDEVEHARRFFVRCRLSLGGRGRAFSYTQHRVRRGMPDVVSGFLSAIDEQLPRIVERLRPVQIVCMDALKVIDLWDSPDTLFYCDPTYLPSARASAAVFEHELTEADHRVLAAKLATLKGKAVLSGYPSPLYAELYGGWRRLLFDLPNNAAGGSRKRRMTECVWLNYAPPVELSTETARRAG